MAYIPKKIKGEDTIYEMVQKINGTMDQLKETDDTAEELRFTVDDIQTSLSNLQTSVFDSIDDAVATSKTYTDNLITSISNNLTQLENKVTSLSEDHLKIQIGTEPPERPNNKTFWLQDLGESINFTSGGGGLIIGNASIDGSSDVWFNENI